ncbi:MAG TPA: YdcF family protein [Candidatus Limnocylindrales bacterium]|nr:YdcF family protein [Candidatus Limnocylindrales bacterium]
MKTKLLFGLFSLLIFAIFLSLAGWLLVRDHPEKSDVIVVLDGDSMDERFQRGMELLRAGYARHLFLDASNASSYYGHTPYEYATVFVMEAARDQAGKVSVCPYAEDSTITETAYIAKCLEPLKPQRVLLVTSDYHTGRALSIFRKKLPQYSWSVAAAHDSRLFGTRWWQHREWAKKTFEEWLKVLWWNGVDRWR